MYNIDLDVRTQTLNFLSRLPLPAQSRLQLPEQSRLQLLQLLVQPKKAAPALTAQEAAILTAQATPL